MHIRYLLVHISNLPISQLYAISYQTVNTRCYMPLYAIIVNLVISGDSGNLHV